MGIKFDGHPDLRRIMMPHNWPNHPLRKELPRGGEHVPFSMTWEDEEFESFGKQIIEARAVQQVPPKQADANKHMILNMGPHHPSTHGVLRVVVELDGETVVAAYPDLGYLHSGFEKQGETIRYKDFLPYTDRIGLPFVDVQQSMLLAGRREADGGRDPAAGAGDSRDHGRAAAHCVAPALAGHARHGRVGHEPCDADVLVPRARATPRHLRAGERRTADHVLYPPRRHLARRAAELRRPGAATFSAPSRPSSTSTNGSWTENPVWKARTVGVGKLTAEQCLALTSPAPSPARRASRSTIARFARTAVTRTTISKSRPRPRATRMPATSSASKRCGKASVSSSRA